MIKYLLPDLMFRLIDKKSKEWITKDIDRNLKWDKKIDKSAKYIKKLNYLLKTNKPFRNIFYFRVREYKRLCSVSKVFLPEIETIELMGSYGGGFMISHNHTVASCTAGENLRLAPGVVIGRNNGAFPKIGNNVYIAANATVIGDVTIGDNVIIGAGSVVTKSLPGNGVYVGNPARFIKNIDNDEKLLNEIR